MTLTDIPSRLPILPVYNIVVLPGETLRVRLLDTTSVRLIEDKLSRHSVTCTLFGLVPLIKKEGALNWTSDLEECIGTVVAISQVVATNWPQPSYSVLMTGLCRFSVEAVIQTNPYPVSRVRQLERILGQEDTEDELSSLDSNSSKETEEVRTLVVELRVLADKLLSISTPSGSHPLPHQLKNFPVSRLTDLVVVLLRPSLQDKSAVLNAVKLKDRLLIALQILRRRLQELSGQSRVMTSEDYPTTRGASSLPQNLGGGFKGELVELEKRLAALDLPEATSMALHKEMKRLKQMSPAIPDFAITRNYIEFAIDLPWNKLTKDEMDLDKAKQVLNDDHFGLEKPKKRVLEFLAVRQLRESFRGPILCLVGPPGVGKTSIARSIARALGRKFHRISLGGIGDQSAIRGHRRTYIGAMAGQILAGLKTAGSRNPVFLLDEMDKMTPVGRSIHGDPAAALLEVLDAEQNATFVDHYLNLPFDLSQVLFIGTANLAQMIPAVLRDRMEVIDITGYTEYEKLDIARNHLLPKQISDHGLVKEEISIPDHTLSGIIEGYTRESGVRSLEQRLGTVCRAVALSVAKSRYEERAKMIEAHSIDEDKSQLEITTSKIPKFPICIDRAAMEDILGPPEFDHEGLFRAVQAGVAVGLVYTEVGGEIIFVEASALPNGTGKIAQLTGSLGKVLKESALIALSWIKSNAYRLNISPDFLSTHDFHIHLPSGSTPKEGPSAGVTLLVALVSLCRNLPLPSGTALSGEVTLRGAVLRVAGIKEKVLAAHRAGVYKVILPAACAPDIGQLPSAIRNDMQFILVSTIEEMLAAAFDDADKHGLRLDPDSKTLRPLSKL